MHKAIFFDRDGTLIVDKHYPNDPDDVEYYNDCFEVLKKMQNQGYLLFIVTNQSGVAQGIIKEQELEAIHKKMDDDFKKQQIKIQEYLSAPYLSSSQHYYRKPNPGMLIEAINAYGIDPKKSWMVGDKLSDVDAGINSGCQSILLSNTSEQETSKHLIAKNLTQAYQLIISA